VNLDDAEEVAKAIQLALDLAETMYSNFGVGLAAPQVGVKLKLLVVDVESRGGKNLHVLINPSLVSANGVNSNPEGCLSLPGVVEHIRRPESILVRYDTITVSGKVERDLYRTFTGYLAVAIQHEMDHLNGKLFIDHLSRLKRGMILKRLAKTKPKDPIVETLMKLRR
jgi:peptide deformylase